MKKVRRVLPICLVLVAALLLVPSSTASHTDRDPVVWWQFDEGDGQELADSANWYDATRGWDDDTSDFDPAWDDTDHVLGGYSLLFDGVRTVGQTRHALNLDAFSIETQVKPQSSGDQGIVEKYESYQIGIVDGEFAASVYSGACSQGPNSWCTNRGPHADSGWVLSGITLPEDEWTEVGFAYNLTHYKFYRDGYLMNVVQPQDLQGEGEVVPMENDNYVGFGARCSASNVQHICNETTDHLDGNLDDVRIYTGVDDLSATFDDYTDDEWRNEPQDVTIECVDPETGACAQVHWRILDEDGNVLDPDGSSYTVESSDTVTVTVGDDHDGELFLEYRGADQNGNTERWNEQRVRVDKIPPDSTIIGPDEDDWMSDDFTVTVADSDEGPSGIGALDMVYIVDTSPSFFDEFGDLEETVDTVETAILDEQSIHLDMTGFILNNQYEGDAGLLRSCKTGQSLPGDLECAQYSGEPTNVTQIDAYLDWLNDRYSTSYTPATYDPMGNLGHPGVSEATSEGWGMGVLDVVDRYNWDEEAARSILIMGDQDANGGRHTLDHPSCGDETSYELAEYTQQLTEQEDISVVSLLGMYTTDPRPEFNYRPECADEPKDDSYDWISEEQMAMQGPVIDYYNAEEVAEHMVAAVDEIDVGMCEYRIRDGDSEWTEWRERHCPGGEIDISVGHTAVNDCTSTGEDACVVETRVHDEADNDGIDRTAFNIDLRSPDIECDDCASPSRLIAGNDVTFLPTVTDRFSGVDTVTICETDDCEYEYCDYDADTEDHCAYISEDGETGAYPFCVQATDHAGNTDVLCDNQFTTHLDIGEDPCLIDDDCIVGECRGGVCMMDHVDPPGIILGSR